ncbi:MAG: thiamine pyrophosphate-dependent dehydrogenase E1 component subunit alpha [Proteobacteria bacterium]|nr:thiamine pyrophosphate-dependent dehydrogenase E1 component subunit alpha [Pseudomonadota bacterium]
MQLSRDDLRTAYRAMVTIREFEERVAVEFETGDMPGFVHLYAGEEAIAVGACLDLDEKDIIGSTHRGHGHCIAKGCDIQGMMLELFGRKGGLCGGKGGSMHIADLDRGMMGANGIVGAGAPLIVGAGLTAKTLKTGGVAIGFVGDGATNQGAVFEAMNLAVVLALPVVFVFENNYIGEATGVDYAVGSGDIAARAAAFGMPVDKVDGRDFFVVHEAMRGCIERARNGDGPSGIEALSPRYYGHFQGDPQNYRGADEVERYRAEHDCLKIFRQRVIDAKLLGDDDLDAIRAEAKALVDGAVAAARAAPPPGPSDLMTDIYVNY